MTIKKSNKTSNAANTPKDSIVGTGVIEAETKAKKVVEEVTVIAFRARRKAQENRVCSDPDMWAGSSKLCFHAFERKKRNTRH